MRGSEFEKALTTDGKQSFFFEVAAGRNRAAVCLPVTVIRNGPGPCVLFTGGNHGDEYEGPFAIMRMIRELGHDDLVCGTVILMPMLNPPAVDAGTRLSPIDGKNLNRVFPGNPRGTVTDRIAHLVTSRVLPPVDVVLDLHAGGRTSDIVPSVMIHKLRNKERLARTVAVMKAFRAPVGILIKEFDSEGMIDSTVERMGKIFGCCELGGIGRVTPESVDVTWTGMTNVLKHLGMMKGRLRTARWRNRRRSRVLEALTFSRYVDAPVGGLYEPLVEIDETVSKQQPLGRILSPDNPGGKPIVCRSSVDGVLYQHRAFCRIAKGDKLALVAEETTRWDHLADQV